MSNIEGIPGLKDCAITGIYSRDALQKENPRVSHVRDRDTKEK